MTQDTLDLDVARKCMLLERVGSIFDTIPMMSPAERVMVIGRGVATASKANENVRALVQETNYIDSLRAAAQSRISGAKPLPAALKSTFGGASAQAAPREASRV